MIRYECDDCGQTVTEDEAIGPGVFISDGSGSWSLGRGFQFQDYDSNFQLVITLSKPDNTVDIHFCYACMWRMLHQMMDTHAPSKEVLASLLKEMTADEYLEQFGRVETEDIVLPELQPTSNVQESSPDVDPEDERSPGSRGTDGDTGT